MAETRSRHPYLNVRIDGETREFRRSTTALPVSFEQLDDNHDVRVAARRQLDLGIDRGVAFARVHVVRTQQKQAYLLCLCDHLALDAKSLVVWLHDVMESLLQGADEELKEFTMMPFVDWTTRIPTNLELEPFIPKGKSLMLECMTPAPEALAANPPPCVQDIVVSVDADVFAALQVVTKQRGTTLNAPLRPHKNIRCVLHVFVMYMFGVGGVCWRGLSEEISK